MRTPLLCDEANVELTHWNPGVFAIQAGVNACAGLQLQEILLVIERPNTNESGLQETHYGGGRTLQHCLQRIFRLAGESCVNIYAQRCLARSPHL
jgi:hypothetical protein